MSLARFCAKSQVTAYLYPVPRYALMSETSLTCTMLLIANRQQVISQLPTDLNPYKKKSQKHCKTNSRKISSDPGGNISVLDNLWLKKVCTHILLHSTLKTWTAKLSFENCLLKLMEYGFCFFFSSYEYNLYTCFSTLNMHNLRKVGWFWNVGGLR